MAAIQPKILTWARETAGLSLADAARALGLTDTRGRTGSQRLEAMERGEDDPTRPVLLKMAKAYRRPLLVFYLEEPRRRKIADRTSAPCPALRSSTLSSTHSYGHQGTPGAHPVDA